MKTETPQTMTATDAAKALGHIEATRSHGDPEADASRIAAEAQAAEIAERTPQPVQIPQCGSTVMVIPVGCKPGDGHCWAARLLSYTPSGQFVVVSTRPDAYTRQTVDSVYVPVAS